jgi:SAM-dependent methyltransferase
MHAQVVSRKRVADHGEVYTRKREVDAMLDLVKSETERIDSRFLEPACGTGNFLAEILRRKLRVVERRYARSALEYERYALLAVSSIYGIDLLEDNVARCRHRLFEIVERSCANLFREDFLRTVRFILERNMVCGDALSLQTVGDNPRPIVFSEWSLVNGSMVKRRDFEFHELLSYAGTKERPLFSDLGDEVFFPEPVKEYPLTHYLKLADAEGK